MIHFIGEFECTMDAKGRIMLPKALLAQLPDDSKQSLIVNCGFEPCLVLYTKEEWNRITTELNKLNTFVKENREFLRLFNRGANVLTLDAAGRVLIPKNLQEYASLKGDVIFSTNSSKIELWNKEKYMSEMNKDPEHYSALAEKVMQNIQW